MSTTTTESPYEIIDQMNKWVNNLTSIYRESDEAYQIVCDYYYEFKNELEKSKNQLKMDKEKIYYDNIIFKLNEGINICPNWVCVEQSMDHFQDLKKVIYNAKQNLESE